jgi:hypothetical protein
MNSVWTPNPISTTMFCLANHWRGVKPEFKIQPCTRAPEGWPKWSPTSACQSRDQVVDKPYESPRSPRAQEADSGHPTPDLGGLRAWPESKIQNSEVAMNR